MPPVAESQLPETAMPGIKRTWFAGYGIRFRTGATVLAGCTALSVDMSCSGYIFSVKNDYSLRYTAAGIGNCF